MSALDRALATLETLDFDVEGGILQDEGLVVTTLTLNEQYRFSGVLGNLEATSDEGVIPFRLYTGYATDEPGVFNVSLTVFNVTFFNLNIGVLGLETEAGGVPSV